MVEEISIISETEQDHPDPKKHQIVSFIKSGIRILGCIFGVYGDVFLLATLLGIAEAVGVYEEMV